MKEETKFIIFVTAFWYFCSFAVFMERMRILKRFSIRILYSFSFLLMAFAMLIMFLYTDRYVILLLSWTIGVTVAVLLTVPYVLVGKYHLNAKVSGCLFSEKNCLLGNFKKAANLIRSQRIKQSALNIDTVCRCLARINQTFPFL